MGNDTAPTQTAPITDAEVVVWVRLNRVLTDEELRLIDRVVQALVQSPPSSVPAFASYYHDDGTKS